MAEKEYIEREALMNYPIRRNNYDKKNGNVNFIDGVESVLEYAEGLPAADVVPVAHGMWKDKPNPQWEAYDIRYCTVCDWSIHKSKLRNADLNWHYCPNCGAKMDEDDNIGVVL